MIDVFNRTGPLMEATSYPEWAQQLIRDCSESKRRVVEHEVYKRMRDNTLSEKTMRLYLIGGWPVVEQFSLYMGHNLGKTRYGRHPGEDMARRWLIRNIRVELNHADYWVNWARAHDVSLDDMNAQDIPAEFQALNDWCWHSCATDSLAVSMAATNYAIEGAVGSLLTVALFVFVCVRGMYIGLWAERAKQYFAAYMAYGLSFLWIGQFLINIGVNVGLLPTKGLTLPFLSYGGSSLVICCVCMGLLLRIEWESRTHLGSEEADFKESDFAEEPTHGR